MRGVAAAAVAAAAASAAAAAALVLAAGHSRRLATPAHGGLGLARDSAWPVYRSPGPGVCGRRRPTCAPAARLCLSFFGCKH